MIYLRGLLARYRQLMDNSPPDTGHALNAPAPRGRWAIASQWTGRLAAQLAASAAVGAALGLAIAAILTAITFFTG